MRKFTFLTLIALFVCAAKYCQAQNNLGIFRQKISVKEYRGQTITLQAAIKSDRLEQGSGAGLILKVQKENKQPGLTLITTSPVTKSEWALYNLSGKIDADADSLSFGGLYQGRGIYSFDDFSLTVNNKQLAVSANGFETENALAPATWQSVLLPEGFTITLSKNNAYGGVQSLLVDGTQGVKVKKYGNNEDVGKYVEVNGIRLYYEIYGTGEPLVLLHGNQQAIEAFTNQISEFAKSYKVIAIDTRGQGKSSTNGDTYTYDLFARDVAGLLDKLEIDSANVVGWSDGGNTGLIMAMKYPRKVKKLVTMGACVFIDKTVVDGKTMKEVNHRIEVLSKDSASQAVNSKRLYTLLLTEPQHSFDDLKTIACPVLVIAGEDDIIKEEHTKGIAKHIVHSKLLIAPKQTHEYPVDNPKSFNEVVLNFLHINQ